MDADATAELRAAVELAQTAFLAATSSCFEVGSTVHDPKILQVLARPCRQHGWRLEAALTALITQLQSRADAPAHAAEVQAAEARRALVPRLLAHVLD